MATDRVRRLCAAAALAALAFLAAPLPGRAATATPAPAPTPSPQPWWVRVAFAGAPVAGVRASGGTIEATVAGVQQLSNDGGRTWHVAGAGSASPFAGVPRSPWREIGGRIGRYDSTGTWHADPGSPPMTPTGGPESGYTLLAAPASLPGVVVAADRDNVAWRRGADGHWARALLLLPQGLTAGPPRITALAAFDTQPLSNTVYMGTDGYSVLESLDGGNDWIRAGPGLPDHVLAVATDPRTAAIYAGTSDGLWVHHLRALPTPPAYSDATLRRSWLGIALVTLAGGAAAVGGLLRLLR